MKFKILIFSVIFSLLTSCEPNISEPLIWSFEEGRIKLTVTGTQDSWADPWQPYIHLYVDDSLKSSQPCLPVFLSDFDKENIKIEWEKDARGRVVFIQRDGEEVELTLPKMSSLLQ